MCSGNRILNIWHLLHRSFENWTYQDFDKIDRKEAAGSSAGSSEPFAVHLLHHGHDISGCQTQLSRTLCVKQISQINYVSKLKSKSQNLSEDF